MIIKIGYLYYDLLNLYGENGNIKALKKQLEAINIKVEIHFLTVGDKIDFNKFDLIYIASGTEENQKIVIKDLLKYKEDLNTQIEKYYRA